MQFTQSGGELREYGKFTVVLQRDSVERKWGFALDLLSGECEE